MTGAFVEKVRNVGTVHKSHNVFHTHTHKGADTTAAKPETPHTK